VGYDTLEEFALRVHSRPLPAAIAGAERHVIEARESRPALSLDVGPGDFDLARLACYAPNQGAMQIERSGREVTAIPREPLRPGRTKYNCTAPSTTERGVYYWYSYIWMMKNADGTWYRE
jgi:hypothetical protein